MKGFICLVLAAFVALSAYNAWQIRALRGDVARLEARLTAQQAAAPADRPLEDAERAVDDARRALATTDLARARTLAADAKARVDAAMRTANDRTAPALAWLRQQAADLSREADSRGRGTR